MWCWLIVFHLFVLYDFVHCITLTEVRVPKHTIRGHAVKLECHYDMEGEALYSVKWYKDGREFYRFVPRDDPPGSVFPQPGIAVDLANSTSEQVILDPLDLSSSGKYRCEVSAEAPSFQTVSDHGEMMVVVHLTWYINGEPAEPGLVKRYEPQITGIDKLETSVLGLEFRVKPKHFKHGDMKLKCLATISTVYWKSNEESVEGEKLQKAPTLESRRAADSRADRVQGNHLLSIVCFPVCRFKSNIFLLTGDRISLSNFIAFFSEFDDVQQLPRIIGRQKVLSGCRQPN
uniref:Ig-like domain-containing protein n=1 Tax=Anopheles maculatus TaxID=74869 RepID=A0A182SYB3_9DIPT